MCKKSVGKYRIAGALSPHFRTGPLARQAQFCQAGLVSTVSARPTRTSLWFACDERGVGSWCSLSPLRWSVAQTPRLSEGIRTAASSGTGMGAGEEMEGGEVREQGGREMQKE